MSGDNQHGHVAGDNINLKRGMSIAIAVEATDPEGNTVPLSEGDVVYFTAKKVNSSKPDIAKTITSFINGIALVFISAADTNRLEPVAYYYDVRAVLAGNTILTLVPKDKEKPAVLNIQDEHEADNSWIIQSEAAKRMLARVSPIYRGPIALWLFEVIGRRWDLAKAYLDYLSRQSTAATADDMLAEWEAAYGISATPEDTIEDRRRAILVRRQAKMPISPWGLEQRLAGRFGRPVEATDGVDPYTIQVAIKESQNAIPPQIELYALHHYLRRITPAHIAVSAEITGSFSASIGMTTAWQEISHQLCGEAEDLL